MSRYISGVDQSGRDNIDVDTELGGKTEWDDILIKHGIKERPTKQLTEDEITSAIAEAKQEYEKDQKGKSLKHGDDDSELDDDEFDDDRLLHQYRQERLKQLKQHQSKSRYGTLIQINEDEYKREVTDASISSPSSTSTSNGDHTDNEKTAKKSKTPVICILFAYSHPASQLFLPFLEKLANKYSSQKFVKIEATKAIPNYPNTSCPTILVYIDTHIVKQFVGLDEFGGVKTNMECIEYVLGNEGYLNGVDADTMDQRDDPRLKLLGRTKLNVASKSAIPAHRRNNHYDDGDDDDSDYD